MTLARLLAELYRGPNIWDMDPLPKATITALLAALAAGVLLLAEGQMEVIAALPTVVAVLFYGLPGGLVAWLGFGMVHYLVMPEMGGLFVIALFLVALLTGVLREGLKWHQQRRDVSKKIQELVLSGCPLDQVMDEAVNLIIKTFHVDQVRISVYSPETGELRLLHKRPPDLPEDWPVTRLRPGEGITGIAFEQAKPQISIDLWSDPRVLTRDFLVKVGLRSCLCLPLMKANKPVGVLLLLSRRRARFSERDIKTFENLSLELVLALEAARTGQEARQKTGMLSALYRMDRAILAQKDIGEVMTMAARLAAQVMKSPSCTIWMLDQREEYLLVKASFGVSEEVLQMLEMLKLRPGEGAAGWSVLEGKPVAIPDVKEDPRLSRLVRVTEVHRVSSILSAPLTAEGKAFGAITVAFSESRSFSVENIEFFRGFADQMAIGIRQARTLEHIQGISLETIKALMLALDARDPYTAGHSQRVAEYALAIADQIGIDENQRQILEYTALLHDIGKVGCDERAWRKPGALDDGEVAEMRKHVIVGTQIFKAIRFLAPAVSWIYHHHEHWDGRGYPDGLKGEDIPLPSRILQVADAYDAMTSSRPYRSAMERSEAVKELERNSGSQFDPVLAKAWLGLLRGGEAPCPV